MNGTVLLRPYLFAAQDLGGRWMISIDLDEKNG